MRPFRSAVSHFYAVTRNAQWSFYTVAMSRLTTLVKKASPAGRLDYRVVIVFCLASTTVLTPIGVYYFVVGSLSMSIGIIGLALVYLVLALWIYRRREALPFNIVLAMIATAATLIPVKALGAVAAPWIHPLILVNYYLLARPVSLVINVCASVVLLLMITQEISLIAVSHHACELAAVMFFAHVFVWDIDRRQSQLRQQTRNDSLTNLDNRRSLDETLQRAEARQQRSGRPLSIIMLDLDQFKSINDDYGHAQGDQVLINVAKLIQSRLRRTDRVFRYGGEEFVVLCEETPLEDATHLAERLRLAVESDLDLGPARVTTSAGVASLREQESIVDCLERADEHLLEAKESGRNRVGHD